MADTAQMQYVIRFDGGTERFDSFDAFAVALQAQMEITIGDEIVVWSEEV